jgi:hypothetical protein
MKTVYSIYNGTPVTAQKNPVRKGAYLMPANSTEFPPPKFDSTTHTAFYNETKWEVIEIPKEPESEEAPESEAEQFPEYLQKRLEAYGTMQQQLEFITEHGLEAWQVKVAEIKTMYPKPE